MRQLQAILLMGVMAWLLGQTLWGSFTVMALADPTGKADAGGASYDRVARPYLAVRDQLPDVEAMGYVNADAARVRHAGYTFGVARWAIAPIDLTHTPDQHAYVLADPRNAAHFAEVCQRYGLTVDRGLGHGLWLLRRDAP